MKHLIPTVLLLVIGTSPAFAQWQQQTINTDADFRGLSAVSGQVAWVSGTKGTFGRTADGGKAWSVGIVPGAEKLDFRDVEAFSENNGGVTNDGGKTWKRTGALPFRSGVAWATDRWIAVGPSGSHASLDDGATWKQLDKENYNAVSFTKTGEGWAAGPKGRIAKFVRQIQTQPRSDKT